MMLTLLLLSVVCTIVSGNRAIATLLSGSPDNAEKYTRLLHSFVYSLRNAGYDGEIVVLYADDFPIDAAKLSQVLNVKTKAVEKITVQHTDGKGNPHYASMLTKLHLWNLLEYSQVMYYDCDFVFQRNPASAFSECSWSSLCATPDTGMHNVNKAIRQGTYFNAGFLVLRPNAATYSDLLAKQHLATNKFFVEQDMLNEVYKGKWGQLDQKYNLMHCYQLQDIPPHIVAIHEKMWILRKSFPEQHYIWNSSKMRVNYPITSLLAGPTEANKKAGGSVKSKPPAEKPSAKMWLNAKLPPKQTLDASGSGHDAKQQPISTILKDTTPPSALVQSTSSNSDTTTATKFALTYTAAGSNNNDAATAVHPQQRDDLWQRKGKKLFSYKREDNESRTTKLLKTFQDREAELLPPNFADKNRSPRNYKIAHKSISEPRKRPQVVRNRPPQWA